MRKVTAHRLAQKLMAYRAVQQEQQFSEEGSGAGMYFLKQI